jgi:hypothetical protein
MRGWIGLCFCLFSVVADQPKYCDIGFAIMESSQGEHENPTWTRRLCSNVLFISAIEQSTTELVWTEDEFVRKDISVFCFNGMMRLAENFPDLKWYMIVSGTTVVALENLLTELETLDNSQPVFVTEHRPSPRRRHASVIMSGALVQLLLKYSPSANSCVRMQMFKQLVIDKAGEDSVISLPGMLVHDPWISFRKSFTHKRIRIISTQTEGHPFQMGLIDFLVNGKMTIWAPEQQTDNAQLVFPIRARLSFSNGPHTCSETISAQQSHLVQHFQDALTGITQVFLFSPALSLNLVVNFKSMWEYLKSIERDITLLAESDISSQKPRVGECAVIFISFPTPKTLAIILDHFNGCVVMSTPQDSISSSLFGTLGSYQHTLYLTVTSRVEKEQMTETFRKSPSARTTILPPVSFIGGDLRRYRGIPELDVLVLLRNTATAGADKVTSTQLKAIMTQHGETLFRNGDPRTQDWFKYVSFLVDSWETVPVASSIALVAEHELLLSKGFDDALRFLTRARTVITDSLDAHIVLLLLGIQHVLVGDENLSMLHRQLSAGCRLGKFASSVDEAVNLIANIL